MPSSQGKAARMPCNRSACTPYSLCSHSHALQPLRNLNLTCGCTLAPVGLADSTLLCCAQPCAAPLASMGAADEAIATEETYMAWQEIRHLKAAKAARDQELAEAQKQLEAERFQVEELERNLLSQVGPQPLHAS